MLSLLNMWLVYALVTIIFSASMEFFVKKAAGRIDDFLGTVIINSFAVVPALVIYFWLKASNQQLLFTKDGALYAALAGILIGIGTITGIKMFSLGANLSLGSPVVRIGIVILTTLAGVFILKEDLSTRQVIGLVTALAGLGLVIFK